MKVKDCMCHDVSYVNADCSVQDCAKIMNEQHVGCIPVCDENKKVVGIVTDRDITLRCVACDKENAKTPVSDIMSCNVCGCDVQENLEDAEKLMGDYQIRRLPILENDKLVGILTIGDLSRNKNVNKEEFSQTLEDICGCNDKNAQ